jgi:hypothetical protein
LRADPALLRFFLPRFRSDPCPYESELGPLCNVSCSLPPRHVKAITHGKEAWRWSLPIAASNGQRQLGWRMPCRVWFEACNFKLSVFASAVILDICKVFVFSDLY